MYIVVVLMGLLSAAGGLEPGHMEMVDLKDTYATKAECEKARADIFNNVMAPINKRFGADNVLATSVCWKHEVGQGV